MPAEWIFQDEGYSGAILVRPGLEALRDLVAEGLISAVRQLKVSNRELLHGAGREISHDHPNRRSPHA